MHRYIPDFALLEGICSAIFPAALLAPSQECRIALSTSFQVFDRRALYKFESFFVFAEMFNTLIRGDKNVGIVPDLYISHSLP